MGAEPAVVGSPVSKSPPASEWPLATAGRSPMGAEHRVIGSSMSESPPGSVKSPMVAVGSLVGLEPTVEGYSVGKQPPVATHGSTAVGERLPVEEWPPFVAGKLPVEGGLLVMA